MSVNLVKLTCTKPLPPDAKIVIKKGKKYAKLQKSGRDVECPVNGKGDRIQLQSSSWYAEWWDSNKKRCRKKLCTNREAAKVMLGELVSKLDRQAAGITDPFESHRRRPIADHLEDFHSYLTAKERAAKHVAETRKQIEAIIEGCKIKLLGDVSATQIQAFLAELRTDKKTPTLPAEDWIEVESAAQILDISRTFLSRQVERYQFARRIEKRKAYLRRDDIATLLVRKSKGKSVRTINAYIVAFKSFIRWCVKDRRIADNPLGHLSGGNNQTDRRHEHRALEADELRNLLNVTGASNDVWRGLSGFDRLLIYSLAASTGLRAGEIASLTPAAFDLSGEAATVRIDAIHAKNRKVANQPIHPDLVEPLRKYLAGRKPTKPVWSGSWNERAAAMLRRDLTAAGIPYHDNEGRVCDFHALRVSFITLLAKSGVHPKMAQELARHSDIRLTMGVYTRLTSSDLNRAVNSLPKLLPPTETTQIVAVSIN